MAIETKLAYSNLTKEEPLVLNSLRDDTFIIIKEADKGSGVVVWDRDDYLKEAKKQLGHQETYEELSSDPVSPLISIANGCLSRVKIRGDVPNETLESFFISKPKLGRFYLLRKIHKQLYNFPGRSVISNSGFFYGKRFSFFRESFEAIIAKSQIIYKGHKRFLEKI